MRKFSLIIIAAVLAMLMLTGCVPEEAPPAADPTAQQALNIANTNTGSIQALAARVGTVEGRTAGEVTQAELDALAGQVAILSAKVTELEDTVAAFNSTNPGEMVTPVAATETRWRYDIAVSTIAEGTDTARNSAIESGLKVSWTKIVPLPIREEDVYELEFAIKNTSIYDIASGDNVAAIISIILTPIDNNVLVSKYTDAYQSATPDIWGVWWDTAVYTNPSTGFCRRIEIDSSEFEVRTLAIDGISTFKLDFNLAYGA
jgi:outer membrane murein-binding lipoprotein Lpp